MLGLLVSNTRTNSARTLGTGLLLPARCREMDPPWDTCPSSGALQQGTLRGSLPTTTQGAGTETNSAMSPQPPAAALTRKPPSHEMSDRADFFLTAAGAGVGAYTDVGILVRDHSVGCVGHLL